MSKNLPPEFLQERHPLLGTEWEAFLQSYDTPRAYGLRRNPFQDCETLPFSLEPVPWTSDGYYFDPEEHPGRHPLHEAGAYYIQEPSAMSVVSLLDPQPGDLVCDLCAAPGGKSTHIASLLQGQGLLVSNEVFPNRARILSQNIERMGIPNALVCNESTESMAAHFPLFFHRIVVDAPCSGEGMFRKDDTAIREWSLDNVTLCADRQKIILNHADQMLQPGGVLVYSTCTFAPEEDEKMIQWFLETHPDYTLTDWHDTSLGKRVAKLPGHAGLCDGVAGEAPEEITAKVLRLWPHKLRGEGHFAARLQKNGTPLPLSVSGTDFSDIKNRDPKKKKKKRSNDKAADLTDFGEFQKQTLSSPLCKSPAPEPYRLETFGDELYRIPAAAPSLAGLKILRSGLHLGTHKKNRFEPAHALAKALNPDQVLQSLSCSYEDACRYLRGETISCDNNRKGWVLVCYSGCSLGWGKAQNGIIKNHYPKGLRIQGWNDL